MATKILKPKYLSSNPSGEDLFEGRSHQKISNTIFELISDKALPNNVIGLEGKWGSGKSNVVSILNKKFEEQKSDYIFFTYDAWGHQEDLTRKTFLEELISHLDNNKKFKGGIDWSKELRRLLAKKSTKNTEKFPKIKFYWILFMSSIFLFSFLKIVYDDFFSKIDLIEGDFPYLKPLLLKYLIPSVAFIWGVRELKKEYDSFDEREKDKSLNYKERLMQLLYVFSGTNLESEELEHVLEEEPSVKSFKEYFEKITKDLKSEGLIIVFDNMDRLSNSDKVLSLWSSIHTFFAEEKIDNVWVIIPYDKQHLSLHFGNNVLESDYTKVENFIGKTFSTVFRISPPVLSDWKSFFSLKFEEAFNNLISNEEMEFISSLYELVIDINNRKPRDIITFINNLVSLHLQHKSSIGVRYQALYALRYNEILQNPLITISNKEFLQEEKHLFRNDKELEESLAAIVYNVDKNKSSEVLLKNNIEEQFIRYDEKTLNNIKKHSDFLSYFGSVFQKQDISQYKPETISNIIKNISDVIPEEFSKRYWEKFSTDVVRRKDNDDFTEFKEWHENSLVNISEKSSKVLADVIVRNSLNRLRSSTDIDTSNYHWTLFALIKFLRENSINIQVEIESVTLKPEDFLYYIDDIHEDFEEGKCTYEDLKLNVNSKDINTYLVKKLPEISEIHSYIHVLEFLIKEDSTYNPKTLKKRIEEQLHEVSYTSEERIQQLLKIIKTISGKKKIKSILKSTSENFLNHFRNNVNGAYFDMVANQISFLEPNEGVNHYLDIELKKIDNAEEIASLIQYYIVYGDLLKFVIDSNESYPLLIEIIKKLTDESYGFTQLLTVKWVFENIELIKNKIFNDDIGVFLTRFDTWKKHFEKSLTEENIFDIGRGSLDLAFDNENHKYFCVKYVYDIAISGLRKANEEDWGENFDSDSNFNYAFTQFLNNNLLDKSITKGSEFMDAYESYIKQIVRREKDVPKEKFIWKKLQEEYLDNRKQKRLFNDFLDLLLDHTEINENEILFLSSGLFKFSSNLYGNEKKSSEFVRKVIIPSKNNENVFKFLFTNYYEDVVKVINSTNEYKQDLFELFSIARENEMLNVQEYDNLIKVTKLSEVDELSEKLNKKDD